MTMSFGVFGQGWIFKFGRGVDARAQQKPPLSPDGNPLLWQTPVASTRALRRLPQAALPLGSRRTCTRILGMLKSRSARNSTCASTWPSSARSRLPATTSTDLMARRPLTARVGARAGEGWDEEGGGGVIGIGLQRLCAFRPCAGCRWQQPPFQPVACFPPPTQACTAPAAPVVVLRW